MAKWWQPTGKKDEIKPVPWFGQPAIDYLASIVTPDMDVIEHGSGGSTLWLADKVKSVTSYEYDEDWYDYVRGSAVKLGKNNITVLLWTGATLPPVKPDSCDLLIIDGEPVNNRRLWIASAHWIVRPGGYVVLDNANRPEYEIDRASMAKDFMDHIIFNCNEVGTKYLVTEFYRKAKPNAARRTKPKQK